MTTGRINQVATINTRPPAKGAGRRENRLEAEGGKATPPPARVVFPSK